MNVADEIRSQLQTRGIMSATEAREASISLAIGEVSRKTGAQPRRFIVSKDGRPLFNVRVLPRRWPFQPAVMAETQRLYRTLDAFKVPALVDHFSTRQGHFFVEEYLPGAVSLAELVARREMSPAEALEVIKKILFAIWESGSKPTESFIEEEKQKFRECLRYFVHPGPLSQLLSGHIDAVVDAAAPGLRTVMCSGDIIDRNVLRVGKSWYLIDFEFSHRTLFLFKEGYRNLLHSSFGASTSLKELCPFLNVPGPIALMLSLLWEARLYEDVLEPHSRKHATESLRLLFWTVVDSTFAERLDRKLADVSEALRERQADVSRLQATLGARDSELTAAGAERDVSMAESAELRSALENRDLQLRGLTGEIESLREMFGSAEAQVGTLGVEREKLREEMVALTSRLAHQGTEIESRDKQITTLSDQALRQRLEMRTELDAREQRSKELVDEIGELRAALDARNTLVGELRKSLDEDHHQLLELKANLVSAEAEREVASAEVQRLHGELGTREQQLDQTHALLSNRDSEIAQLQFDADDFHERLTGLEAERSDLRRALEAYEDRWLSRLSRSIRNFGSRLRKVLFQSGNTIRSSFFGIALTSYRLIPVPDRYKRSMGRSIVPLLFGQGRAQLAREMEVIRKSGLFDARYYLAKNPDVAQSGVDALLHFVKRGASERRNPSPSFDTDYYVRNNPDVLAAGPNPLVHYITNGVSEGRATTQVNPLVHFIDNGIAEGKETKSADEATANNGIMSAVTNLYPNESDASGAIVDRDDEYMPRGDPGSIPPVARCIAFYVTEGIENEEDAACASFLAHAAEREIARSYGIEGFCYCMSGIRDAELPSQLFRSVLAATDDFPFCLCVFDVESMTYDLGPERDTPGTAPPRSARAFVESIARLLAHPSYLRIEGAAILLVHKAADIPNIVELARGWRDHAFSRGLGELFLIGTNAPDYNHKLIGFDAAIESSPNVSGSVGIGSTGERYGDYREWVSRSYGQMEGSDRLLRTVCTDTHVPLAQSPSRMKSGNSSPAAYQEWLENVCRSVQMTKDSLGRMIFINAWNSSSAGSTLRPSSRYGCAYVNATAKALQTVAYQERSLSIAVIAHVFYDDVWPEIASHLRGWRTPFRLYVTVPDDRSEAIAGSIRSDWPKAIITTVPNRGRDIAPFLRQSRRACSDGAELICKVHTKKSPHRADGNEWGRDLYEKLLGDERRSEAAVAAFAANAALGIVAPEGHIVPGKFYWGANASRVLALAAKIGYVGSPEPFSFAAGSMFWIRSSALEPILGLRIGIDEFEEEQGQVDGTLAHALERLFPIAAKLGGYRLADTRVLDSIGKAPAGLRSDRELAHLEHRKPDYPFAPASALA